jgi:hypothetical protein
MHQQARGKPVTAGAATTPITTPSSVRRMPRRTTSARTSAGLRARRSQTKEAPGEAEAGAEKEDFGIIPLGVPMLAGPGAISAVMVLVRLVSTPWCGTDSLSGAGVGMSARPRGHPGTHECVRHLITTEYL